jgi:hypothetical protein
MYCSLGRSVKLVDEGNGVRHLDRELDRFERDMKCIERDMNREIRRLSRRLRWQRGEQGILLKFFG